MEEQEKTLAETIKGLLEIVRRYALYLLIPFLIISIISIIVAFKVPMAYVSMGTILIEQQQVPQNMIQTTVTGLADERIWFIRQRVMTRERILSIIDKYHLYPKKREKLPPSELVEQFQNNVKVETIAADVKTPQGLPSKATFSFNIAFKSDQPETAYAIANELVNLFLAENSRVRTQRATDTTVFLNEEAERLNRSIADTDGKIAELKEKFGRSLPELLPANLSAAERVTSELLQTENQMDLLKERIAYLTLSIPGARQGASLNQPQGEKKPLSREEQIRVLEAEYMRLTSQYHTSHPDVVRVERQIKALDPAFTGTPDRQDVADELEMTERELEAAQEKYGDSHPDVARLKQKARSLKQQSGSGPAASRPAPEPAAGSSDPIYITLVGQLNSAQSELGGRVKRYAELQKTLEQLNNAIAQTPQVERGYNQLMREREANLAKYAEVKAKVAQAKLAQTLEEEQKGESFSLIEPPVVPDKPEKGTRMKVFLTGLGGGLLVGLGMVFLADVLDSTVRGHKSLQAVTGIPPMIVIPYIDNDEDLQRRRRRVKLAQAAGLAFLASMVLLVHLLVMPLNEIWGKLVLMIQRL